MVVRRPLGLRGDKGKMLTTAILAAGLVLTTIIAVLMVRPALRLPSLLFAALAVPGNVDNLMPQMRLDPHELANNTAPAISVVDLLLIWALVLTFRERHSIPAGRFERLALAGAAMTSILAVVSAVIALAGGVEPAAVVRGVVVFLRILTVVYLAIALRDATGDGQWIAAGVALAGVALLANGLYTSTAEDLTRFTASTIGRNGFSLALVLTCVAAGGIALLYGADRAHDMDRWRSWALAIAATLVGAASIFGAVATGTRMSLLALIPALVGTLAVSRFWRRQGGVHAVTVALIVLVLATIAGGLWSTEGGRAISVVTDVGDTIDIITNPDDQPSFSPVRSRTEFWSKAVHMIHDHPLTGVGPYQWNFVRYTLESAAPRVVADPHNAYLQIGAEYGIPTLVAYLVLLGIVGVGVLYGAARYPRPFAYPLIAVVAGAVIYPLTELTNAHLFNVRLGIVGWTFMAVALVTLRSSLVPRTVMARRNERPRSAEGCAAR